jgi:hypothetical protein
MGYVAVNGFTGSPIWHLLYTFPPCVPGQIDAGFREFGETWKDILGVFNRENIEWALEIHPTEIAFDIASTRRTLAAVGHHPRFGFNFDPSHFGYQGIDYLGIIREFGSGFVTYHVKDYVRWSDVPTEAAGCLRRPHRFRRARPSVGLPFAGRGRLDFEAILRALNHANYKGPLSVEWEDPMMDREAGAAESVPPSCGGSITPLRDVRSTPRSPKASAERPTMTDANPGSAASIKPRLSLMMFLQYAIWGSWLPILYPFLLGHRGFSLDQTGWCLGGGCRGRDLRTGARGPTGGSQHRDREVARVQPSRRSGGRLAIGNSSRVYGSARSERDLRIGLRADARADELVGVRAPSRS